MKALRYALSLLTLPFLALLLPMFEAYALVKRKLGKPPEDVPVIRLVFFLPFLYDVLMNFTWCALFFGEPAKLKVSRYFYWTVSGRISTYYREGSKTGFERKVVNILAHYLNKRDPGHV